MSASKLMIVDDDHTMVTLLQTLLELDGFEVLPATQTRGLVARVLRERPDLLIMDVFLSQHDGIELLREVRATPEIARTPVIMTSGMDVSDRCMEAGADGFVLKPYSPPDLINLIQEKLS